MKTASALAILTLTMAPAHAAVTFDWATIANPSNADDVSGFGPGFGGVAYTYRISKYEVTNAQYTDFLNAVDPSGANPLSLYDPGMSFDARGGIILNGGAANGSKYEIRSGRGNNPVILVSFFDAMRFANWLQNGQGSGGTESGVYTIGNGVNEVRSATAKYWIPSEDEWYKAAYYDPSTRLYYDYPTGTNAVPFSDHPASLNTPNNTNVANFSKDDLTANGYDDGFAVTGSPNIVSTQNYLTDVGAYSLSRSPYGTFDQGGNVLEWTEGLVTPAVRSLRGGSFFGSEFGMLSIARNGDEPAFAFLFGGFRVASIPEPNTMLMGAWAAVALTAWQKVARKAL